MRLAWRGPDRPNPDRDAVRLVYVDREPTDELVARDAEVARARERLSARLHRCDACDW